MAFITKIVDYIVKNYDLRKDTLTIVFPNKRAALSLKKELTKREKGNIWLPQIITIQDVMSEWSGLQLIDNIDIIFELLKINSDLNNSADVKNEFFGLAAQMAKDFDEIDQYAVDAKTLFRHLSDAKKLETWELDENSNIETNYVKFFTSLYDYYERLRASLLRNNMGYYGLITRYLYEYINESPKEFLENKIKDRKLIFAGFNALTKTEESIIVKMVETDNAVILWDLDKYYYEDDKQEAGLFARHFFKNHPKIPLNFLGDSLITDDKQLNIIGVSGSSIQTNALLLQLNKEDKETHNNNEAIVLADETLLIPVLNSIPDTCNDIQVTMGYPFVKTSIYQFVTQLFKFNIGLSAKESKVYLWSFMRVIDLEFFKIVFDKETVKQLNEWIKGMVSKSEYYIDKEKTDLLTSNEVLHSFIVLCTKKWLSTDESISTLKEILEFTGKLMSESDNYFIKNQISNAGRIINRLEKLIKKFGTLIQIADLEMLFEQVANETSIRLNGSSDGLQIMGLLETRNLDFNVVHILSVNEGTLPQSKSDNSLIPFDLRKAYGLPIYQHKHAVYSYHFYRLIQNCKVINLYYNTLAEGMGQGEPSRYIRQLQYEYAINMPKVNIKMYNYENPSVTICETIPIEVEKTPEIMDKIIHKISDNEKCGLAPTSMSSFINCPLQFYLKYIERVNDNTLEEDIQANVIGSIIHDTLDYLYQIFKNQPIDLKKYESVVDNHFDDCYKEALKHNNFPNGLPKTGYNYLTKEVINSMLHNFIKSEKEFIKNFNSLQIIGLEKELSHIFNHKGVTVKLFGRADRIDKVGNEIRVIDYKTGKVEDSNVNITEKQNTIDSINEKSLQLLIYKYLYLKSNTNLGNIQVNPGIIGLQKLSHGIFSLSIDLEHDLSKLFIKTCEDWFHEIFENLLDEKIPFKPTEDESHCKYCDFKTICGRD